MCIGNRRIHSFLSYSKLAFCDVIIELMCDSCFWFLLVSQNVLWSTASPLLKLLSKSIRKISLCHCLLLIFSMKLTINIRFENYCCFEETLKCCGFLLLNSNSKLLQSLVFKTSEFEVLIIDAGGKTISRLNEISDEKKLEIKKMVFILNKVCFLLHFDFMTNSFTGCFFSCFRSKHEDNTWTLQPRGQDWNQSLHALNISWSDPTYIAVSQHR